MKKHKTLILIPARGGSKRIPGKNLQILGNKTLLARCIHLAKSLEIEHSVVVVSSENKEILREAKRSGAKTIERPAHLATDTASSVDVTLHAIKESPCDFICLLQCTSPFTKKADVLRAHKIIRETRRPVLAATFKSLFLGFPGGSVPRVLAPSGNFYFTTPQFLKDYKSFKEPNVIYLKVTEGAALDIDVEKDLVAARAMLATLRGAT